VSSEDPSGFDLSGALLLGVSVINRSYAARPDNTGLTLMRYAGHADVDLIGRKLSIPVDINMFTDKTRQGLAVLAPSELDVITGVTTTHSVTAGGDLELGARVEHDRPVDRGGFTQSYADVRARYLYSLAKVWPSLGRDLVDGDINGFATLGWFAINPTYAARPDNSGIALFRYAVHAELSVWHDYLSIGVDGNLFTDRHSAIPVAPSELDLTYEVIVHVAPFEWHLAASAARRASYLWGYSTDGGKTWAEVGPTLQAKTTVSGLPAGTTVQFRYRGVTKTGAADWSQPISLLVK